MMPDETRQPKRFKRKIQKIFGAALIVMFALVSVLGLWGSEAPAEDHALPGKALTHEHEAQILRLFQRYMSEHPEDIVKALESYAVKEKKAREDSVKQTLAEGRSEIERDEGSFVGGNPEGDISLVEFFDYRCSYCKRVHSVVQNLLKRDGNIRLVYKEFPILGPDSVLATQAALASRRQGKYLELHNALMLAHGALNQDRIMEIAQDTGVDVVRLETDMNDPEIEKIINRNYALAQRLAIGGTPAFVIGDELLSGAADIGRFKTLVDEARANCKTC